MTHPLHPAHAFGVTRRVLAPLALVACVLAAVAACNRGKQAPAGGQASAPGQAPSTAASPLGYCSATITGAQTVSFTAQAEEEDFDTDYWRTVAETRELIQAMLTFDEYQVFDRDEPYLIEQAMARDPRLTLFVMDCSGEAGGVMFVPGRMSRYADVPFGPRTYEIAPAPRLEAVTTGAFFARVHVGTGPNRLDYVVTEPGTLAISVFNELQMAGTFSFKASAAGDKRIVVQGRFDFRKPKDEFTQP